MDIHFGQTVRWQPNGLIGSMPAAAVIATNAVNQDGRHGLLLRLKEQCLRLDPQEGTIAFLNPGEQVFALDDEIWP